MITSTFYWGESLCQTGYVDFPDDKQYDFWYFPCGRLDGDELSSRPVIRWKRTTTRRVARKSSRGWTGPGHK